MRDETATRNSRTPLPARKSVRPERVAAASSLRSVAEPAALQVILLGTEDGEPFVRARAAEVLAQRTEPVSLSRLERMLDRDPDPRVRLAAVAALAHRASDPAVASMLRRRVGNDVDAPRPPARLAAAGEPALAAATRPARGTGRSSRCRPRPGTEQFGSIGGLPRVDDRGAWNAGTWES
ncbi:MAG TPA: HEAT repeat domain-containing protein [Planctomycetota bacterium]